MAAQPGKRMNTGHVFMRPLLIYKLNNLYINKLGNRQIRGSALPICLMLSGILGILAVSALRSATAEARLGVSVLAAHQAFSLAQRGSTTALRYAMRQPENLPALQSIPLIIPVAQPASPGHSIETEIAAFGIDADCPYLHDDAILNVERQHYEIRSTGRASTSATRIHVQGFYICHEICSGNGCIGTVTPPVPSYWTWAES